MEYPCLHIHGCIHTKVHFYITHNSRCRPRVPIALYLFSSATMWRQIISANVNNKISSFRRIKPFSSIEIMSALAVPISGSGGGLYANERFTDDVDTLLRRKELHFVITEEFISDNQLAEFGTRLQNLVSVGSCKMLILQSILHDICNKYMFQYK